MITAIQMINKIIWDPNEDKKDYEFTYVDFRIEKTLPFNEIVELDEGWFVILKEQKFCTIPTHRIRKFIKKGEVIWERVVGQVV